MALGTVSIGVGHASHARRVAASGGLDELDYYVAAPFDLQPGLFPEQLRGEAEVLTAAAPETDPFIWR